MINKNIKLGIFLCFTIILGSKCLFTVIGTSFETTIHWPTTEWQNGEPDDFGLDRSIINEMLEVLDTSTTPVEHVTVSKNGSMLTEYYSLTTKKDKNFTYYHVAKGLAAILTGIAIDKGIIPNVDESIWSYFNISERENVNAQKEAINIKHLLTCTAGFTWKTENTTTYAHSGNDFNKYRASDNWANYVLDLPMEFTPGEVFVYNSGATHLLNCILAQKINSTIREFATQYLFNPLGIKMGDWTTDPQGVHDGASGIYISGHDLAKIGLLLVNNGTWDGSEIISSNYVNDMFTDHFNVGYGYQFWLENNEIYGENVWSCKGIYDAKRITLQFDQQVVTTITCFSGTDWTDRILTEYIIPASTPKSSSTNTFLLLPFISMISLTITKKKKKK